MQSVGGVGKVLLVVLAAAGACKGREDRQVGPVGSAATTTPRPVEVPPVSTEVAPAPARNAEPAPPDVARPPADARRSERGVFYKILKAAPGAAHPKPSDRVKIHYTGWTVDGRMFDSSKTSGRPIEFALSGVIAGWSDGIQQIGVGERARLWIPEVLAYQGKSGPAGMLVFDIELLEIK